MATLKRPKNGFQDQFSLKQVRSITSAILSTFIKLPFVIKIFVLCIWEWPLKTGFTVYIKIWTSIPDFGTCRIGEQCRLK